MTEAVVRASFHAQAGWCEKLGSPFTARLLLAADAVLDHRSALGRAVLDWRGDDPSALGDGLALRLAGALQRLVLAGQSPQLAALYPPAALPSVETLRSALADVFVQHEAALLAGLEFAPQTNEVARSALLMPGLMTIAEKTGARLALHELGASAGLNLCLDHFAYRLGGRALGGTGAEPLLAPGWAGEAPSGPVPGIVSRRGCDINPLDIRRPDHSLRLRSFIWPDQAERIARFEAAAKVARNIDFALDAGDAADWVEREVRLGADGICTVLFHSIAFQYFPAAGQRRIEAHMMRLGGMSSARQPVAWLAFEQIGEKGAHLVLRLWPGGQFTVLARADAHVRAVRWFGPDVAHGATLDLAMASRPANR